MKPDRGLQFRIVFKIVDRGWWSVLFVQGLPQPLLQDGKINGLHVTESQSHPQGRLRVNHRGGGFKKLTAGINL